MKPIRFNQSNIVFGRNQQEYEDLPAFVDEEGNVVQCWQLTDEEIKEVKKTGCIWVMQKTFKKPLQPILLSTKPLIQDLEFEEAEQIMIINGEAIKYKEGNLTSEQINFPFKFYFRTDSDIRHLMPERLLEIAKNGVSFVGANLHYSEADDFWTCVIQNDES